MSDKLHEYYAELYRLESEARTLQALLMSVQTKLMSHRSRLSIVCDSKGIRNILDGEELK